MFLFVEPRPFARQVPGKSALEATPAEAPGVGQQVGRVECVFSGFIILDRRAQRRRALFRVEQTGLSVEHALHRAASPISDHGAAGGLGFNQGDAEVLLGGVHETPGSAQQLLDDGLRLPAEQAHVRPGDALQSPPFGALADHQQRQLEFVEGCHHQFDFLMQRQPGDGYVITLPGRQRPEFLHFHRRVDHRACRR